MLMFPVATSNTPPVLDRPLPTISTQLGTYFRYVIADDTFHDEQDGGTRDLDLNLLTLDRQPVPASHWVQLDASSRTIYGLAVSTRNYSSSSSVVTDSLLLRATDSGNMTTVADLDLTIDTSSVRNVSHQFVMLLGVSIAVFDADIDLIVLLNTRLSTYFGDSESHHYITMLGIENVDNATIELRWTNNTVDKTVCENETIVDLFTRLTSGHDLDPLQASLGEFPVQSVAVEYLGVCAHAGYQPPPAVARSSDDSNPGGMSVWMVGVIVAGVAIVAIALVLAVSCCVRDQCRSNGRYGVKNSGNNTSSNKRRSMLTKPRKPFVFEDDLEMQDSPQLAKPRHPMVLEIDMESSPYAFSNPSYDHHAESGAGGDGDGEIPTVAAAAAPAYDATGDSDGEFVGVVIDTPPQQVPASPLSLDYQYPSGVSLSLGRSRNRPPPAYRLPPPYYERGEFQ